jgi:hypothetical protein
MALLSLSSCQSTKIKNQKWCGDFSPYGADCFETLTTKTWSLSQAEWDKERFGQVCTASKNYGDLKAALEKLCSAGRCTFVKDTLIFENEEKLGTFRSDEQRFIRLAHAFLLNVKHVNDKARRLRPIP